MALNVKKLFKYKKLINFYPPYLGAGIRLKEVNKKGNSYLIELKLRWYNRNVYGSHFGGSLYAMCDPWYVFIAYSHFGDDYILWDRSAHIQFVSPGKGPVHALFQISNEELVGMKAKVDKEGKSTFQFETKVLDKKNKVVARVKKEIYIRKKAMT